MRTRLTLYALKKCIKLEIHPQDTAYVQYNIVYMQPYIVNKSYFNGTRIVLCLLLKNLQ